MDKKTSDQENDPDKEGLLPQLRKALHDLRTPLAVIELYAELLFKASKDDRENAAGKILGANKRATLLSQDMSTVIRIAEGSYVPTVTTTTIEDAFGVAVQKYRSCTEKNIQLSDPPQAGAPIAINTDQEILTLFFIDLIAWATTTLSEAHIDLTISDRPGYVDIVVTFNNTIEHSSNSTNPPADAWHIYAANTYAPILDASFYTQTFSSRVTITVNIQKT